MSAVKKVCINSSKNYYTGTELSPLHYGLSAEGYDINSIMEGYDKELWIVDVKNNKKIWTKNDQLSRITHEEPVIKNIMSLYCETEDIEKINQLKQMCGKDGSYNLKDIKKFYNVCDDECDNEIDENRTDIQTDGKNNKCPIIANTDAANDTVNTANDTVNADDTVADTTGTTGTAGTPSNEEKEGNIIDKKGASNMAKCITRDINTNDVLKGGKGRKGTQGNVSKTKTKTTVVSTQETNSENIDIVKGEDKKPTDYNIFVKFRLNELKDISTNKKENFENVKIEWRELKKNKAQIKIVMEKAYEWLNNNK
jgi:hypothetical protein